MPTYQAQPITDITKGIASINDSLLWSAFIVVLAVFGIFTWILTYHWRNFDVKGSFLTLKAKVVYFMGAAIIIFAMIMAIIYG